MKPDNFQQAWQSSESERRITIDSGLLLKEVQRNDQQFRATILMRDIREVVVALILIPVWLYMGATLNLGWTWYLTIPGLIFIAAFMIIDRFRHNQRPPEQGEPLRQQVECSLAQVEHQIWLLRNVFWWYILPIALPCAAFFAQVAWGNRARGWDNILSTLFSATFAGGIMVFIYWLNQKAVRSGLEPRRQELAELLSSLDDETE
jgi:hypothetical protein